MDNNPKETNIVIDKLDGYSGEPHTCMSTMSGSSIANSSVSSMLVQKPIQVVPPTPVVRHVASPSTIAVDTGQAQPLQPAAATPSSMSFAVANLGGQSAPLLQQNVNIMNINLPTAVTASSMSAALSQPTTSMATTSGSSTTAATLIQLPDGRLLLQQSAPNIAPTIAFVSVPAGSTPSQAVPIAQHPAAISTASQPVQSFAITVPTSLAQQGATFPAYGQPTGQPTTQVQQPAVQVVGMTAASPSVQQQTQTTQIVMSAAANGSPSTAGRRPQIKPSASPQVQPCTRKPSHISSCGPVPSSSTGTVAVAAPKAPPSCSKHSASASATSALQLSSHMPPEELRKKIDMQISRLRALPQPSDKDLSMLQRLQEFSDQIPAPRQEEDSQGSFPEAGSPAARTASPTSRVLAPRPKPRDAYGLLSETRDLMERPPPHEETLLVEFRIHGQRFMLRLSRPQKAELETVLAKAAPDQQQKILQLVHDKHVALASINTQTSGCLRGASIVQPCAQSAAQVQLPPPQLQAVPVPAPQANQAAARLRRVTTSPAANLALSATSRKIVTSNPQPAQPVQQTAASSNSSTRPSRTAQQMVLTPQMRRSLQIRRQLQTEQQKAACPATGEPFRLVKEAAIALMKYHVYQDTDNSEHAVREADSIIGDAFRLLRDRQRHVVAAVRRLERRCVSRNGAAPIAPEEGGPNAEEAFVITDMALDLERDTMEAERARFQNQPRSFQPLDFDLRTGKATPVPLLPPPCEEEEEEEEEEVEIKEEAMEEDVEEPEVKEDVWESILEPERDEQNSPAEEEPCPKRLRLPGLTLEESETDRAVAAIMGDAPSWAVKNEPLIHSEDPDVDAAIRSIM